MSITKDSLLQARKSSGLSQEEVADKLHVSRQTISKWELGETTPNLTQAQRLAALYGISLDELSSFDAEKKRIETAINNTSEETQKRIDWTSMWAKKYPILAKYQKEVDIEYYASEIKKLLGEIRSTYGYNDVDAMLVFKDILAHCYK